MENDELKSALQQLAQQQSEILKRLEAQERATERARKDFWDRLGALAPIISAAIIACIGAYFTYTYNLQQLKVQEIQTIERFIPHLIGTEKSKRAAILAINSLGNTALAAKVASIFASEGTVSALQSIAADTNTKERTIIEDHLARALDSLAEKYRTENKNDEAMSAYKQALEIKEQLLGKDSPDVVQNLERLSELYKKHGDLEMADELAKRAIALRKKQSTSATPIAPASDSAPSEQPASTPEVNEASTSEKLDEGAQSQPQEKTVKPADLPKPLTRSARPREAERANHKAEEASATTSTTPWH